MLTSKNARKCWEEEGNIIKYWKVTCIPKKRETVKVLYHQQLNLLNELIYMLQSADLDTFIQVSEKERKKKEKEEKGLLRDIFA